MSRSVKAGLAVDRAVSFELRFHISEYFIFPQFPRIHTLLNSCFQEQLWFLVLATSCGPPRASLHRIDVLRYKPYTLSICLCSSPRGRYMSTCYLPSVSFGLFPEKKLAFGISSVEIPWLETILPPITHLEELINTSFYHKIYVLLRVCYESEVFNLSSIKPHLKSCLLFCIFSHFQKSAVTFPLKLNKTRQVFGKLKTKERRILLQKNYYVT